VYAVFTQIYSILHKISITSKHYYVAKQ